MKIKLFCVHLFKFVRLLQLCTSRYSKEARNQVLRKIINKKFKQEVIFTRIRWLRYFGYFRHLVSQNYCGKLQWPFLVGFWWCKIQIQKKKLKSNPCLSWAWPSSAPACVLPFPPFHFNRFSWIHFLLYWNWNFSFTIQL